jgi:ribonuclease HII
MVRQGTIEEVRANRCPYILGTDEVGYGAWAGPLMVVGVVAEKTWKIAGLADSKKLTKAKRERMNEALQREVERGNIFYETSVSTPREIDNFGVGKALRLSHELAITELFITSPWSPRKMLVVVDGTVKANVDMDRVRDAFSVKKADTMISVVMAASIIAKVARDAIMCTIHERYPVYDFRSHKGYGTPKHLAALKEHGPARVHRKSYRPVKEAMPRPDKDESAA